MLFENKESFENIIILINTMCRRTALQCVRDSYYARGSSIKVDKRNLVVLCIY